MLLVTRVLVIMQLTALLRYPRVTALRFPPSIRSAFQFQKGFRSSIVNTNNGRTTVRMFSTAAVDAIVSAIASKGDEIRVLKSNKAGKDAITPLISELLQLKVDFQALTGNPFDAPKEEKIPSPSAVVVSPKEKKSKKEDSQQNNINQAKGTESSVITPRTTDYSAW